MDIRAIRNAKGDKRIVMLTAYDALFAKLLAPLCDILLVGDSLHMSFGGKKDTLGLSLEQMIYHVNAVCSGAPDAFVVVDMPFGSEYDAKSALLSSIQIYQRTKASAVKIEGGVEKAEVVKYLVSNKIAVMGHIGLLPQTFRREGGYIVRGKDEADIEALLRDALAIEEAGAFALVIEGVKPAAAEQITKKLTIPTIGIGAGASCDGQVLVFSDMLGLNEEFKPKFVRTYMDGVSAVKSAAQQFAEDVRSGNFPNESESY